MLPGDQEFPHHSTGGDEALSDAMEKMVALANGVHSDLVALPDDLRLAGTSCLRAAHFWIGLRGITN